MLVPNRSDVEGQLQWIIDMHYDSPSAPHQPSLLTPCLPGFGPDLQVPIDFVTDRLWQATTQLTGRARALADIATFLSRYFHTKYCQLSASGNGSRACARDVGAVTDLISMITSPFLDLELDAPLKVVAMETLTSRGATEIQVSDALDAVFQRITHPTWGSRKLLTPSADKPIIQINSAITRISPPEYYRIRSIALALRSDLIKLGYEVEVTSDYAAPRANQSCGTNETLTRAAIYRTAGMICIADHGHLGTGTTLTLAGELLIPSLVLYQDPSDVMCSRYPSGLARRTTLPYGSPDEALQAAMQYLKSARDMIFARGRQIFEWSIDDISQVKERFSVTEVSSFDHSPVTYDRAQLFTSDPILWNQCTGRTRDEIVRILGLTENHRTSSPPARNRRLEDASPTSISALLVAAAHKGWTPARTHAVYDAYLLAHDRSLSTRKSSWGFEEWIRFEATLP